MLEQYEAYSKQKSPTDCVGGEFFWDRECGSELSGLSGYRVKSTFLNAFQPRILKGLAGVAGPSKAGMGVHSKVLPIALLKVAELKPRA